MAIVSSELIWFMGKEFKRVIRVFATGTFKIKLPEQLCRIYGDTDVEGKTMDDVLVKFGEALKNYEDSETEIRKVILYDMQDDISFAKGSACAVAAGVYLEKSYRVPGETSIKYHYNKVPGIENLPASIRSNDLIPRFGERADDSRCLLWTFELHTFFKDMASAMRTLRQNLMSLKNDPGRVKVLAKVGFQLLE